MKVNSVLLTSIVASFFWGAASDEGGLRNLGKDFLAKGEGKTKGQTKGPKEDVLKFELYGGVDISIGDIEEFSEEVCKCLGFDNAESVSVTLEKTITDSGRRLGRYTRIIGGARRSSSDNNGRRLELPTPASANACMASGFCAAAPAKAACAGGVEVGSITVTEA